MTTPVLTMGDFVVCFEAEAEDMSARHHFIKECGWTESQFRRIADMPFFCAKVSIWREGKELACDYLGACCYKTEEEFYTTHAPWYFADMVSTCIHEINNAELTAAAAPWLKAMRAKVDAHNKARAKREAAKAARNAAKVTA